MNLRTAIITATTAAVLATSGVAIAGAASSSTPKPAAVTTTTTAPKPATAAPAAIPAARLGKLGPAIRKEIRRGAIRIVTEQLGITKKTLRADLLSGQTIADIAGTKGVDPNHVISVLVTAGDAKLAAAAQAGLITSARATRIENRLPALATKFVDTWLPKRARTSTPPAS